MTELFKFLQRLPPLISVIALAMALFIIAIYKWDTIIKSTKSILGKSSKRTCGDCVLILFGIREKYEYEDRRLDTSLLRLQMKFAEQKIQEAIFFLSQSFSDDIRILGEGEASEKKAIQSALYCEALKNGMLSVKDELRRSFKENGFASFSEGEFTHYVKGKTITMLTIIRSYLDRHYVDCDRTIVHLKERFEKMDKYHIQKFEGWAFDVFINAKDIIDDIDKKKKINHENLKKEINEFVKNEQSQPNC